MASFSELFKVTSVDVTIRGSFLLFGSSFTVWWIVKRSGCGLSEMCPYYDCIITGFLISFYSFQDGVTLYFLSGDPDYFLHSGSVLVSLPLLFVSWAKELECFFVWRFCGHANNRSDRKIRATILCFC